MLIELKLVLQAFFFFVNDYEVHSSYNFAPCWFSVFSWKGIKRVTSGFFCWFSNHTAEHIPIQFKFWKHNPCLFVLLHVHETVLWYSGVKYVTVVTATVNNQPWEEFMTCYLCILYSMALYKLYRQRWVNILTWFNGTVNQGQDIHNALDHL